MLLAMIAVSVSLDPITTVSPALARSYHMSTGAAGWIVSAWGAGAVVGITLGRRFIVYVTHHGAGWAGLLLQAIGLAALGAAPAFGAAIPAALLTGFGYITSAIAFVTTIQSDVPERLRGRVMALWVVSFLGPRVVSAIIDGALADAAGPRVATAVFAAPALIAAFFVRNTNPPEKIDPVTPAA